MYTLFVDTIMHGSRLIPTLSASESNTGTFDGRPSFEKDRFVDECRRKGTSASSTLCFHA